MSATRQAAGSLGESGSRPHGPSRLAALGLAAAAVAGAAMVVGLGTVLGPTRHAAAVVALAVGMPATLLFVVRPRAVLVVYLFALPLAAGGAIAAGLNAGELLTLGVLALGVLSLWTHGERFSEAITRLSPILLPLVGFAIVSVASMLVNEIHSLEGVIAALFKAVAFGLVALLVYVHADTRESARSLLLAILMGGAAVGVYSIVAYLLGWSYSAQYGYNRAMGTFSTWNHLGGFMALVSVPTLALAVTTRRSGYRALLMLAFVAEVVALLLSLTLGSIVALVIGAVLAALLVFRVDWRRLIGPGLLAVAVFAAGVAANPLLREKLVRIDERVIDRLRTYQVGISMFRDQFWFGFGSPERVETILLVTNRYGLTSLGETRTVPHNSLLLMGVEKGVFGLLFFTLLVAGSIWLLVRARRAFEGSSLALLYQGLIVGAFAFLVQSMTNNLLVHARLGILYFAIVAITLRLAQFAAAEEEPEPETARP